MSQTFPALRTLLPHSGSMCLLERIVTAGERDIVCATHSHLAADNPLRHHGRLAALHLAEYGAQTMAIHGGLANPGAPARGGMLVAIRDLKLAVARLDDLPGELLVQANQLIANAEGRIYLFTAQVGGRELGRGRVTVMFAPAG